jgi:ribonucleoside-diphosphate reductase alpha chain
MQVRALDNVLDVTFWPLPQQRAEAKAKRRIGVGFTGMGNTLAMLCLRYDSAGRPRHGQAHCRAHARCGVLRIGGAGAREGAFPKFDADGYLAKAPLPAACPSPSRRSHPRARHPQQPPAVDRAHGHGEPGLCRQRLQRHRAAVLLDVQARKREADGSMAEYAVEDHSWRLYRELGGDVDKLPEYFVSALEMSAQDHIAMMEVVQPFVDTAISKTVNIPADYPYDDFKGLYLQAWRAASRAWPPTGPTTSWVPCWRPTPPHLRPLKAKRQRRSPPRWTPCAP